MAKQKTMTYDNIIAELKNITLTKRKLPRLITICSNAIDTIGCQLLEQYEQHYPEITTEMLLLKQKQRRLIKIRDYLYNLHNEVSSIPTNIHTKDKAAMTGISRTTIPDDTAIGSWSC